jgi:carbonic anhydrase/acetyltransferase-like protein (isoleucine patch superfamily)
MIISYRGKTPKVHPSAFIAPTAVLIGDVEIGEESSIWFGAVLRGDEGPIRVGKRTSVQDNTVIHVVNLTQIDDDVTIGHAAVIEDCHVKNHALIGMKAVVLNGSVVGEGAVIAAGAVVGEGVEIPDRVLAAGVPAKVKKEIGEEIALRIEMGAREYVHLTRVYKEEGIDAART